MKLLFLLFVSIIPRNYGITVGQSRATALADYNSFGSDSVSFMLSLENNSNQPLTDPQYIEHAGYVYTRPVTVAPNMAEYMTGKKTSYSFLGVSGVVSWNIGDTNKMVVVMYEKPWSTLLFSNSLAVGIFPKGDLTGFFEKMNIGEEEGFERHYYPGDDGWMTPIRYKKDENFVVEASMGDASKGSINIQFWPKSYSGLADPTNDGSKQMVDYYNTED